VEFAAQIWISSFLKLIMSQAGLAYTHRTLIKNADQLVVVCSNKERVKKGKDMDQVEIIANGSLVIGHDGKIVAVGSADAIAAQFTDATFEHVVEAKGKSVVPGLCDAHTHPVWSGDRVHEFKAKLAGATYLQIHEMGGGIGFTVRHTHASSEEELEELFEQRLNRMLKFGTLLLEAKSGYGLDWANELKMLKVIHAVAKRHPIHIVSNYCGAHSVPKGLTAVEATKDIVENQIPALVKAKEAGEIDPELIDVFCEKGVFEAKESRAILAAGQKAGLKINFHGDELNPTHSAELGAELGALAISHLECISEEGMAAMAEKEVVGVLLPTTAYVLRIHPPPARKMIDAGIPVALGSDFNPNAHCLSMPHVMNLACVMMRMTMNEALVAATINSAASMDRAHSHGSLEVGKQGDVVVLSTSSWEHLIYQQVDPPIESVLRAGKVVFQRS